MTRRQLAGPVGAVLAGGTKGLVQAVQRLDEHVRPVRFELVAGRAPPQRVAEGARYRAHDGLDRLDLVGQRAAQSGQLLDVSSDHAHRGSPPPSG